MDPNANLSEQEDIIERGIGNLDVRRGDRARLRELRFALEQWLIRGGFEPDWSQCPRAATYYGRNRITA